MRILVVEDEEDLRELICFTLESQFNADVVQASSGNQAIRLLDESGDFDCIVSDYSMPDGTGEDLYRHVIGSRQRVPFILVSAHSADTYQIFRQHPIAGFIPKPDIFKPLKRIIESLNLGAQEPSSRYCRVKTNVILKYGLLAQDLYIRLSEGKYVKIFRRGDVFDLHDFERFKAKTVEHLYLKSQDCEEFLESLNKNIAKALEGDPSADEVSAIVSSSIELVSDISKRLGFTNQVQELTRVSVNLALKSILKNLEQNKAFDVHIADKQGYVATHSIALAHVACGIASLLGWTSGPTFLKLSLAAFLHDVTLDNPEMALLQGIEDLELQRHRFNDAEVKDYLGHTLAAAKLAKELKDLPPDVETIIQQHHERPDGNGILRLDNAQITPLSAVFIVAHEL
ncbi:MAG: response regulator [Deltaproteobacteria bacterium]|nr:response regulator [Deltaproteobacteria bacterium]